VREEWLAAGARPLVGWRCRRGPWSQVPDVAADCGRISDAMGRGVRSWPHQPVLPTVGGSPAAVAYGGRNSKRRGPRRQMYTYTKF
jgi:hypothetical protein